MIIMSDIKKSNKYISVEIPLDEYTNEVQNNFDFKFDGISKFYPYILPSYIYYLNYNKLVITGASGKGKSTLAKSFSDLHKAQIKQNKCLASHFNTLQEASDKLNAVGLSNKKDWVKSPSVLSVGQSFRFHVAINLNDNAVFDEFTSNVDRTVAKDMCKSLNEYIENNHLKNMIFISCHKDFISFLNPDIVIDLDDEIIIDYKEQYDISDLNYIDFYEKKQKGKYIGELII